MNVETENREEALEDIPQSLGALLTEQMARQTEINQQQNAAIAAIAEGVLKRDKDEDRGAGIFLERRIIIQ